MQNPYLPIQSCMRLGTDKSLDRATWLTRPMQQTAKLPYTVLRWKSKYNQRVCCQPGIVQCTLALT
jgi:hypothetical protein